MMRSEVVLGTVRKEGGDNTWAVSARSQMFFLQFLLQLSSIVLVPRRVRGCNFEHLREDTLDEPDIVITDADSTGEGEDLTREAFYTPAMVDPRVPSRWEHN